MSAADLRLLTLTESIGERCQAKIVSVSTDILENDRPNIVDQDVLKTVLAKIAMCPNLDSLFAMELEMNDLGLTFYTIPGGKAVLCKIINGIPTISNAMVDHIILGPAASKNVSFEISDRMVSCIQMFINAAASGPSRIMMKNKAWHNNPVLYAQK